jgi:hypothetical protein
VVDDVALGHVFLPVLLFSSVSIITLWLSILIWEINIAPFVITVHNQ